MITPQGTVVVGTKGHSGRKPLPVEMAKRMALIKAWNKVEASVDSSDVEKVALPLALKTMVDKQEIKAFVGIAQADMIQSKEAINNFLDEYSGNTKLKQAGTNKGIIPV